MMGTSNRGTILSVRSRGPFKRILKLRLGNIAITLLLVLCAMGVCGFFAAQTVEFVSVYLDANRQESHFRLVGDPAALSSLDISRQLPDAASSYRDSDRLDPELADLSRTLAKIKALDARKPSATDTLRDAALILRQGDIDSEQQQLLIAYIAAVPFDEQVASQVREALDRCVEKDKSRVLVKDDVMQSAAQKWSPLLWSKLKSYRSGSDRTIRIAIGSLDSNAPLDVPLRSEAEAASELEPSYSVIEPLIESSERKAANAGGDGKGFAFDISDEATMNQLVERWIDQSPSADVRKSIESLALSKVKELAKADRPDFVRAPDWYSQLARAWRSDEMLGNLLLLLRERQAITKTDELSAAHFRRLLFWASASSNADFIPAVISAMPSGRETEPESSRESQSQTSVEELAGAALINLVPEDLGDLQASLFEETPRGRVAREILLLRESWPSSIVDFLIVNATKPATSAQFRWVKSAVLDIDSEDF